uniref:FtsH ternary system domain-containing protein n=1 Tax=Candidatus Kentrum sp. TUN TaxID=2126343 RepID=A0A451A4J8_9GAMM|nr:MAG: hypothetical protein BECKTUN1418D_GA0071000_11397 [Candidatus Kentron sp. TUN]
MCNPRRIEVTATRQVRESWQREIRRVAEVSGTAHGEARIRQPLDASVGAPALMALQTLLATGFEGWAEQEDGSYRRSVEGGYAAYSPESRTLTIVATLSEEIRETGKAQETLSGDYEDRIEATGTGQFYDDGWGGYDEEHAHREAQRTAEVTLDEDVRRRFLDAADSAERERDAQLHAEAERNARQRLAARATERQVDLDARAREHLEDVGIRARQAFHHLLASAYRDALLSLARRRGVDSDRIITNESDEYLEIEFELP